MRHLDRRLGSPSRRLFTAAAVSAALVAALPVAAKDSALPVPASLQQSGRDATAKGEPLVLLVSLPGCPYCELVRRSYLLPMREEGLQAWQISVDDHRQPIADFQGTASNGELLAAHWKVKVTPTVLFLDASGTEIAPRLEGIAVADFYGAYLDQALESARAQLKHRK